jgi:hypothetical protein
MNEVIVHSALPNTENNGYSLRFSTSFLQDSKTHIVSEFPTTNQSTRTEQNASTWSRIVDVSEIRNERDDNGRNVSFKSVTGYRKTERFNTLNACYREKSIAYS